MLRRVSHAALDRLCNAAQECDADLDHALLSVGVLAPLDLDQIRGWLTHPGATLSSKQTSDGQRLIEVTDDGCETAWIHHDGRIVVG